MPPAGQQLLLAKRVGRPHSQNAHRPIVGNTQVILQSQPGVHHLTGVTITAFAIVSELHRMGGAQDQLNPQQPFKGLQAAADGRPVVSICPAAAESDPASTMRI